jgi:pyruvate/2-oxoglutarate dehydrogenase complex dihydrolipoamide acyltransferase (E2) component
MMTLTLSADHRVVDGARAAIFLQELAEAIEAPGITLQSEI